MGAWCGASSSLDLVAQVCQPPPSKTSPRWRWWTRDVDVSMIPTRGAHLSLTACRGSVTTSFASRLPGTRWSSAELGVATPRAGGDWPRGASPRASRCFIRKACVDVGWWIRRESIWRLLGIRVSIWIVSRWSLGKVGLFYRLELSLEGIDNVSWLSTMKLWYC